jgi:predicted homoserine dehydrogenase-like protein
MLTIKDKLIDPYTIVVEDSQYVVGIEKTFAKKGGGEYNVFQNPKHFTSFERCLDYIARVAISNSVDTVTISDYIRQYREAKQLLKENIKDL